jgi:hypothetical protein
LWALILNNVIICNYAADPIFFAQWVGKPIMAGRPAKARQVGNVPMAIGTSTDNASIYHTLNWFLIFTNAIADRYQIIL